MTHTYGDILWEWCSSKESPVGFLPSSTILCKEAPEIIWGLVQWVKYKQEEYKNIKEAGSEGIVVKMSTLCLTHNWQQEVKHIYLPTLTSQSLFSP